MSRPSKIRDILCEWVVTVDGLLEIITNLMKTFFKIIKTLKINHTILKIKTSH